MDADYSAQGRLRVASAVLNVLASFSLTPTKLTRPNISRIHSSSHFLAEADDVKLFFCTNSRYRFQNEVDKLASTLIGYSGCGNTRIQVTVQRNRNLISRLYL